MRINHNLSASNTYRQLTMNNANQAKNMEKLSSGLRINRAADDAAGLSISEKMRSQIRGLDQATKNSQDAISMIQTADGALNETHSILQRMRELSVQSSTDTLAQTDRDAINEEMGALKDQIDTISQTTQFNGKNLLNGNLSTKLDGAATLKDGAALEAGKSKILSVDVSGVKANTNFTVEQGTGTDELKLTLDNGLTQTIKLTDSMFDTKDKQSVLNFDQLGVKINLESTATGGTAVNAVAALKGLTLKTDAASGSAEFSVGSNGTTDETISVAFKDMSSTALGLTSLTMTDVATSKTVTSTLDDAIASVSKQRSTLGAVQNRLEFTTNNLASTSQNLTAAESRIRDVDMAKEVMESSKNGILAQAAQAMLGQANQQPQQVLQLLRG